MEKWMISWKWLSYLKNLVYWYNTLAKQLKLKQKNKKEDFSVCYGVHSRNKLPKIKNGTYVINLDEFKSKAIYLITSYVGGNNIIYYDSLGVDHISKEIKKFIENKSIITNICRIQTYDSIMCGYFCIEFIYFLLKGKSFLDDTNLFSLNDYAKNDKIILKYFQ